MTPGTERKLRIGTRGSKLALWQAEHVAQRLKSLPEAPPVEIVRIKTEGDRIRDVPLSSIQGKGFFTKEIEKALLDEIVDLAVHSLKDLETEMPSGLALTAILEREDPRDVLIAPRGVGVADLPAGARVGTSSLRRKALLANWRDDLRVIDLRGNVPTRLQKYENGDYDAIVLAAAGVKRLGFEEYIGSYIPVEKILPAVSQGAVAVQTREGDDETARWLSDLDDPKTRVATTAERSLMRSLQGGCQVPVGALGTVDGEDLELQAGVCSLDGNKYVSAVDRDQASNAVAVGVRLAQTLLDNGAAAILEKIRSALG